MPTDRIAYQYHFKKGNRILHRGITVDLQLCEYKHQQTPGWSNGHILQIGCRTTRVAALEWEREQGKLGKPVRLPPN